jgi:hypothetical protein
VSVCVFIYRKLKLLRAPIDKRESEELESFTNNFSFSLRHLCSHLALRHPPVGAESNFSHEHEAGGWRRRRIGSYLFFPRVGRTHVMLSQAIYHRSRGRRAICEKITIKNFIDKREMPPLVMNSVYRIPSQRYKFNFLPSFVRHSDVKSLCVSALVYGVFTVSESKSPSVPPNSSSIPRSLQPRIPHKL